MESVLSPPAPDCFNCLFYGGGLKRHIAGGSSKHCSNLRTRHALSYIACVLAEPSTYLSFHPPTIPVWIIDCCWPDVPDAWRSKSRNWLFSSARLALFFHQIYKPQDCVHTNSYMVVLCFWFRRTFDFENQIWVNVIWHSVHIYCRIELYACSLSLCSLSCSFKHMKVCLPNLPPFN